MKLLIIEDEVGLQKQYRWSLNDYDLLYAGDRESALEALKQAPELVLLDLGLPPDPDNATEGLALLSDITSKLPATKVIVLTGSEQKEHALASVKLGAYNFLQKGVSMDELKVALSTAAKMQKLEKENHELRNQQASTTNIIGQSPVMLDVMKRMKRVAVLNVSTLLAGESGTGKELFAQNIHSHSGRAGKFVAVNCASIPGELLESQLFGHVRGAFTGAVKASDGLVKSADGGTLFLDEIGDMPLELQSKMLRFLQERTIQPVGSTKQVPVDVRIVCATHQDLDAMVKEGTFREDLYFRLAEFKLNIPALRDRDSDIIALANKILFEYRKVLGVEDVAKNFSTQAVTAMLYHKWPGNVRELQNAIKGALIECDTLLISPEDMGLRLPQDASYALPKWFNPAYMSDDELKYSMKLDDIVNHAAAEALLMAYRRHNGNVKRAAEELGVSRPTFYNRCEKYGLKIEDM